MEIDLMQFFAFFLVDFLLIQILILSGMYLLSISIRFVFSFNANRFQFVNYI